MLTERRADILGMLVSEYITSAVPVSSRALVDQQTLDVSSATVRNELAALEEDGYITHPYTSAGRVPSDLGYRLYVESLMAEEPVVPAEQRTVEHQFHQASADLDGWLGLAAAVLAGWVGNAAVVTRPRAPIGRLKHLQLVHLRDDSALLVAVMEDARVRQRVLPLAVAADQQMLSERAERVNARLAGQDAATAFAAAREMADLDDEMVATVAGDLINERPPAESTYLDGVQAVLEQPEFADPGRMLEASRHLAAYDLYEVVEESAGTAGIATPGSLRVIIGSENEDGWMHEWSVVASMYGDVNGPSGTVAVVGPMRMHYARTIPRVRYVASLMSDLIHEVVA
ncbi:MAG TPA: heat-inducible transcriptional repressor HrcA [Dehalococcoidia bacterium]|nr:heat-inducible transcriptional repressor HrcA [Dehalococcoidia bacterium]